MVWKKIYMYTRNKDNYCYIIKKNFLVGRYIEKLKWNQNDRLKEHDDYDIYKAKTTKKNRIINHTFTYASVRAIPYFHISCVSSFIVETWAKLIYLLINYLPIFFFLSFFLSFWLNHPTLSARNSTDYYILYNKIGNKISHTFICPST